MMLPLWVQPRYAVAPIGETRALSEQSVCSKCGSTSLKWVSVKRHVPIDALQCQRCGASVAEEDWVAPLAPYLPENCVNCSDRRNFGTCVNCGLTASR